MYSWCLTSTYYGIKYGEEHAGGTRRMQPQIKMAFYMLQNHALTFLDGIIIALSVSHWIFAKPFSPT